MKTGEGRGNDGLWKARKTKPRKETLAAGRFAPASRLILQ